MRKSLASGVGVAAALVVVFGSGSASAVNEFNGQTYGKAKERVSSWGGTLIISTREGSYLPTEQCLIVGTRSSGQSGGKYLVDLNCNAPTAQSGHPGNSAATTEGQKAKALRDTSIRLSENYASAVAAGKPPFCDDHVTYCQKQCQASGVCSDELLESLGL